MEEERREGKFVSGTFLLGISQSCNVTWKLGKKGLENGIGIGQSFSLPNGPGSRLLGRFRDWPREFSMGFCANGKRTFFRL